jgi:hypothetical protein
MFPTHFADEVIRLYTNPGDLVIDPFAGRGTSIFSAAAQERFGIGVEINPVGWVYANAKLCPAAAEDVAARLAAIGQIAAHFRHAADQLPRFFHYCFAPRTRAFLLAARDQLDWRRNRIDRTVMAIVLVHLHGKRTDSLSNQMRQTKALSPQYAIRWWRQHNLTPPRLDPVDFLVRKLQWRYARGAPAFRQSHVYLGDSTTRLSMVRRRIESGALPRATLLFTSPPYYQVTNYHYDQWLRLWLLGGPPNALRVGGRHRGKFEDRTGYRSLLSDVFGKSASLLSRSAVIYVRTDHRSVTYQTTREVLKEVFGRRRLIQRFRPVGKPTQTQLFGNHQQPEGEVDFILLPA